MNQEVLTLTPGGQPIAQSMGFDLASVVVDNYTSSYVSLPDAGKTLPPWVYGAVVSLPLGLRTARAKLIATVPAIAGPPVPLSQCTLTWLDVALPDNPGHLLQQSTLQVPTVIGTIDLNGNGDTSTQTFPLPAGSQGVGWVVNVSGTKQQVATITVTGAQSNELYLASGVGEADGRTVAVPGASTELFPFDTSVKCSVTTQSIPGAAEVIFFAYPYNPRMRVGNVPGVPLLVTMASSGLIGAALWQAPNLKCIDMTHAFGAGGQVTYVAGVAGQVVYLLGMTYTLDAAGGAGTGLGFYDGDPSGAGVRIGDLTEVGTTGPFVVDGHGGPVTSAGNGFFAKSDAAVTVRGLLFVSQG